MNRRGFLGRLLAGAVLGAVNGWLPGKAQSFSLRPEAVPTPKSVMISVSIPGSGMFLMMDVASESAPSARAWLNNCARELGEQVAAGSRYLQITHKLSADLKPPPSGGMWLTL